MTAFRFSMLGGLGLGLLVAGAAVGCGSSKSTPSSTTTGGAASSAGGTTGAAGSTAAGGTASNTGGAAATGGAGACVPPTSTGGTGPDPCATTSSPCSGTPAACTAVAPTNALITDWADICTTTDCYGQFVDNDTYSAPGDNWWTHFFGGPYVYPVNGTDTPNCTTTALSQTVSAHSWHITGTVGNDAGQYAGWGLWFAPCMSDFSAYGGISFTVSGSAGSTGVVTVTVSTSSNSVHNPNSCDTNVDTCTATEADGGSACKPASATFTVTGSTTTVTLRWTDFTGGNPSASPSPAEIRGIGFAPPDPYTYGWDNDACVVTRTATPYNLDITIGDITLVQ
jgi:hypothetical protein